jgi:hypothetical protein
MIRVDAMDIKKPNSILENVKLTQLRKPHIVVQDKYIEALSYAHDGVRRADSVHFRRVAEFTMPAVFESMYHIAFVEQSCVVL